MGHVGVERTESGMLIQHPVISAAKLKFVVVLPAGLNGNLDSEVMLARFIDHAMHFLGLPLGVGEGAGNEDGGPKSALAIADGD